MKAFACHYLTTIQWWWGGGLKGGGNSWQEEKIVILIRAFLQNLRLGWDNGYYYSCQMTFSCRWRRKKKRVNKRVEEFFGEELLLMEKVLVPFEVFLSIRFLRRFWTFFKLAKPSHNGGAVAEFSKALERISKNTNQKPWPRSISKTIVIAYCCYPRSLSHV